MNYKFIPVILVISLLIGCNQKEPLGELRTQLMAQPDSSLIHLSKKGDNNYFINYMRCPKCTYAGRYFEREFYLVLKETENSDSIMTALKTFCAENNKEAKAGDRSMVVLYDNDVDFAIRFTDFYFFKILKLEPETGWEILFKRDGNYK